MAKSKEQYIAERTEYNYEEELYQFTLIDKPTVERLQKRGDISVPKKKIDIPKDEKWNTKKMNSKVLQGIVNGDSIPKIAKSLEEVIGANSVSAIRNARTMTTEAECGGRMDSYKDLDAQGVVQKKVWMATPDDRTRESHLEIDGEEQDIDKPFSNGCMFPADGSAPPEEVWNCRCTMTDHIIGFRRSDGTISYVEKDRDATLHDQQMQAEKDRRQAEKEAKALNMSNVSDAVASMISYAVMDADNQKYYDRLMNYVNTNGIDYKEVEELSKPLTEAEIIAKLAGADQTVGSCASLALSYCGNKVGLDVTDFRGGASQKCFSRNSNIDSMLKIANANMQVTQVKQEAKDIAKILKGLEIDKEYILYCGRHASIIKNTSEGVKYLEMQSSIQNGWRNMEYTRQTPWGENKITVADTLHDRFGCRKTVDRMNIGGQKVVFEKTCTLAEVDSFQKTKEFKEAFGYINTATDQQKKGAGGGIK